jgi:hypothetical protein
MSTLTTIRTLVRYLLNETSKSQVPGDIFPAGSSSVYTLTENNPIEIIDVFVNDSSSGVSYSFNSISNKVTITSDLVSDDTIEIQYTYYPNYSNTEIDNYIRSAIVHLSINNYYTFEIASEDGTIYPEPDENESNLIAFLTATLIEPNNQIYRLPDITVQIPNPLSKDDMIRKAIAIFKYQSHGVFVLA